MTSKSQNSSQTPGAELPADLRQGIFDAGYYPEIVVDLVSTALAGERVTSHLVHQETTFDNAETFRRHITVLVLTPSRLLVAHADDHQGHPLAMSQTPFAAASVESVLIRRIRSAVLATVVHEPEKYQPGSTPDEATVTLCWGTQQRIDVEPASCPDPECTADHGFTGQATSDDIVVRISGAADGDGAVERAVQFTKEVNRALTHQHTPRSS